jgi:uncharacterized protein
MKPHSDTQHGTLRISAYDAHSVTVGDTRLEASFVITTTELHPALQLPGLDALRWAHLDRVIGSELQVLLLGTGARQRFPASELLVESAARGIGLEVMDSQAACRTYNILAGEGRQVAALILLGDAGR